MDTAEITAMIEDLETRVERLRALYEQYFMGIERVEPAVLRKEVDRRLWLLRREQIRNTGLRFKLQTTVQRYNTYQQYWQRICREIENGTYRRDISRAAERFGEAALTALGRRRQKMFERGLSRKAERDAQRRQKQASEAPIDDLTDLTDEALVEVSDATSPSVADVSLLSAPAAALSSSSMLAKAASSASMKAAVPSSASMKAAVPSSASMKAATASSDSMAATTAKRPPASSQRAPASLGPLELDMISDFIDGIDALHSPTSSPPPASAPAPSVGRETRVDAAGAEANRGDVGRGDVGGSLPSRAEVAPRSLPARPPVERLELELVRAEPRHPAVPPEPGPSRTPAPPQTAQTKPPSSSPAKLQPRSMPFAKLASPPAPPPVPRTVVRAPERPLPPREPEPPRVPASPEAPDLSPARLRQVYGRYVEAKRECNESTASITFDRVVQDLRATAERLRTRYPDKQIDFDVVIKNGTPVFRPIVRGGPGS